MNNTRRERIIANLDGLGTSFGQMYTNQEIIDLLKELQDALARGVFEKTHAENLKSKDIMIHFEALAKDRGLDTSDTYIRFRNNMGQMCFTIGSLIKGKQGEQNVKRALKRLSFNDGVHILYNVQLEDEDTQTEYDAIVIAKYGLFVVEAKNWGSKITICPDGRIRCDRCVKDFLGNASAKEAILMNTLKSLFPPAYHTLLYVANEFAEVEGHHDDIEVARGDISYRIASHAADGEVLSDEEIGKVVEILEVSQKEQRGACLINCKEIIEDYATLMTQIEDAPSVDVGFSADTCSRDPATETSQKSTHFSWIKRIDWGNVVAGLITIAVPSVVTAVVIHKQ